MNVCVVGAGDLGTAHAHSWRDHAGARVVAIADVDLSRAEKLAAEFDGALATTDYKEAVSRDGVEAVSVCVPAYYHPEVAIFAAEHGRHVLTEKPIALTLEGADRMIEAANTNGVKMAVGMQRRHSEIAKAAAEYVQGGGLGRPVMAWLHSAIRFRWKIAMHDAERGNGGPIVDIGVHYYDLWRMIFGSDPVRVGASGITIARDRPELASIATKAIDAASLWVEYASGDVGAMLLCWGLPPGVETRAGEHLLGPKGMLQFKGKALVHTGEEGKEVLRREFTDDMRQTLTQHFAKCIREGGDPYPSAEDGRMALKVARAALDAIETKTVIDL